MGSFSDYESLYTPEQRSANVDFNSILNSQQFPPVRNELENILNMFIALNDQNLIEQMTILRHQLNHPYTSQLPLGPFYDILANHPNIWNIFEKAFPYSPVVLVLRYLELPRIIRMFYLSPTFTSHPDNYHNIENIVDYATKSGKSGRAYLSPINWTWRTYVLSQYLYGMLFTYDPNNDSAINVLLTNILNDNNDIKFWDFHVHHLLIAMIMIRYNENIKYVDALNFSVLRGFSFANINVETFTTNNIQESFKRRPCSDLVYFDFGDGHQMCGLLVIGNIFHSLLSHVGCFGLLDKALWIGPCISHENPGPVDKITMNKSFLFKTQGNVAILLTIGFFHYFWPK